MEIQSLHNVSEASAVLVRTPGNPGDLTGVLQHITRTAQDAFGTDACVILAFNPITGGFMGSETFGNVQAENRLLHDKPGADGVTQQVLKDGIFLVEDLEAMPQYHNRFTRAVGIRAFAGLAMRSRHRQRPLGVIYLDFKHPREFSSTDCESYQIFAVQASFLLQETWLAHNYEEVARIGQKVNHNLAMVDDLFQELQTFVETVLDDSHALLLAIYQSQTNTLDFHIREHGHTLYMNRPLQGACQHVIETQESWFIQQFSKEAEQLPFQMSNIATGSEQKESLIFVPLMLRGISLGVLSIQHPLPDAYGQEDLFILQLLANYISLALHNMRLYNSLNQLNETGQVLTQQLESQQTLQATVDKIRNVTQADIVVLYPYEPTPRRFILPPRIAGTLRSSPPEHMSPSRPNDVASVALRHVEPIFAKKSDTIYTKLQNDVHIRQENFQQREEIRSTAVVPLRVGDESVGVLFINFRQTQRFDATQKLFIEGLAHYAAIAIKNSQVFGTLSMRRLRELEILQKIDRELSRILDLESLLDTLLKLAHEQVPAEGASILLYNSRTEALESAAAIGRHAEARRNLVVPLQETKGISRWAMEQKKPARVGNVHSDPQWRELYIQAADDTIAELDVPLLDGEEVVGVLNFESTREEAFSQEDEHFLLTLAGQAVLAIKNAQAYEREKRLGQESRVLNEISKEITIQLDHVRVFELILEKALELTNSGTGTLELYDPDQNDLWMAAERGVVKERKGKRLSLDQGVVGYAATNKHLLNVDLSQPPWNGLYVRSILGTRSELAVPMLAGDELRGVLNVESPSPHNFSERDEHLMQGLADLAVVALQNAERYRQAEREAQRFKLLYQASQELSKITDWAELELAYDIILHIAEEHSQSQVFIRRYDENTQELVMIRTSKSQQFPLSSRKNLDVGINGQVARERRTIVIHDTNNPPTDVVSAQLSDPTTRSLFITPIMFKDQYYGNLGLRHKEVGYFQGTDLIFFEGLAQQLASTIYRLETAQARQEFEQRALSAEEMSSIGQSAFEVTHRLGNDLGLIEFYVSDIHSELEKLGVTNAFLSQKMEDIVQSVQAVLSFSTDLKNELAKMGDKEKAAGEPVLVSPEELLEEASAFSPLPPNIQIEVAIDDAVAPVKIIRSLVADILRNLVANAIYAMPHGGKITLRGHNAGRSVALEVIDTGVGISPQKLSNIFDLFFSTKGSSGFGLWSARRNALKNHGELKVESQLGQGTTFTLLLPRTDSGTP